MVWAVLYVRASSGRAPWEGDIRAETLRSGTEGVHHTDLWGESVPGRGPSRHKAVHMVGVRPVCFGKDSGMAVCRGWPGLREQSEKEQEAGSNCLHWCFH